MRQKSQATEKVRQYIMTLRTRYGKKPKIFRSDNGTEYINDDLVTWCKENGIELQRTAPYSPQQNGTAERLNRTLVELARAMLIERNLPECLWAEAVLHAAYLRNRAPTRALQGATPEGLWSQKKPRVDHLQEFGAPVYVLLEGANQSKLSAKSVKQVFVGFADGSSAIKYYDGRTRQVKVSRNYRFLRETPVLQREEVNGGGSKDAQASTGAVDAQTDPKAKDAIPTQSVVREGEDSRKRTHPDVESEPRKSKRQTIRHDYQKLHDPDPEWAYLEHESGYTEEEYTEISKILSSLTGDGGLNTGDPKTL
jgi:hypothetical protein